METESKSKLTVGGDLNTKFFHQMASARKKRKRLVGLENDRGNVLILRMELRVLSYLISHIFFKPLRAWRILIV